MAIQWEYKNIPGLGIRKVRLITLEEHDESFDKNLCLICKESWVLGHTCPRSEIAHLIYVDIAADLMENEVNSDVEVESVYNHSKGIETLIHLEDITSDYNGDLKEKSSGSKVLDDKVEIDENDDVFGHTEVVESDVSIIITDGEIPVGVRKNEVSKDAIDLMDGHEDMIDGIYFEMSDQVHLDKDGNPQENDQTHQEIEIHEAGLQVSEAGMSHTNDKEKEEQLREYLDQRLSQENTPVLQHEDVHPSNERKGLPDILEGDSLCLDSIGAIFEGEKFVFGYEHNKNKDRANFEGIQDSSCPCEELFKSNDRIIIKESGVQIPSNEDINVILMNLEQMPWFIVKLPAWNVNGGTLIFEYHEVTAEEIMVQLIHQGFQVHDFQNGVMGQLSGEVRIMSRLMNINIRIYMGAPGLFDEDFTSKDYGTYSEKNGFPSNFCSTNDDSTQFRMANYRTRCDKQATSGKDKLVGRLNNHSFTMKGKCQLNLEHEADATSNQTEKSKMEPTTTEYEHVAQRVHIIEYGDLEEIKEIGSGTYESVCHGFMVKMDNLDEIQRNMVMVYFKEANEEVYKILVKVTMIIWGWFYKDSLNEKEMIHPGKWIVEWKIA